MQTKLNIVAIECKTQVFQKIQAAAVQQLCTEHPRDLPLVQALGPGTTQELTDTLYQRALPSVS